MRRIEVKVDDTIAVVSLRVDRAPNATQLLLDALPLEGTLRHARWSGNCAKAQFDGLLKELHVEDQVSFCYPNSLVYRPDLGELTWAYGQAQIRDWRGTHWATYLGDVVENREALSRKLQDTRDIGTKTVYINQMAGSQ